MAAQREIGRGRGRQGRAADPAVGDVERFRVPLEGPVRGPANAKVTIVAFSDFQCPFCSRVVPTLEKIMKDYPTTVRHLLPAQPAALPPRRAAGGRGGAGRRGRRASSGRCTTSCSPTSRTSSAPILEKYAGELGLDVGKFKTALDTLGAQEPHRRRPGPRAPDRRAGHAELLHQRPHRPGAQPFDEFKKVIDDEIARADKILAQRRAGGPALRDVHGGRQDRAARRPRRSPQPPKGPGAGAEVYKVAVGDAPTKGGKQPKVTIVEFSDFQCPFCGRVDADAREAR